MKKLLILSLSLIVLVGYSQTSTKNYVKTATARQATGSSIITSSSSNLTKQSIQYMDGLGRPAQFIVRWGSGNGNDLVTPIVYDQFGRQVKTFLPYEAGQTSANFRTNAMSEQASDHVALYGNDGNYAYTEVGYEPSPLNRTELQAAPGYSWRKGGGANVTITYEANEANTVKRWEYGDLQVSARDYYPAEELYKTTTADEDGNPTIEYVNKRGLTLLKKSRVAGSTWAETYYIYDVLDRLRVVLPPQANAEVANRLLQVNGYTNIESSQNVTSNGNYVYTLNATVTIPAGTTLTSGHITPLEVLSPEFLADWAFQYTYDSRNRMTSKQVPGAAPVYMVYDQWDRLVLTQDGNQRVTNEWLFTKYDALNRPVMTGKKVISGDLQTIRNAVAASTNWAETFTSGSLEGYSNATYPSSGVTSADLLTVTYYDNYDFVSGTDLSGTTYQQVYTGSDVWHIATPSTQNNAVKGQVTGTLTRAAGTDFITTITYYDDKYRPVQIVSENHLHANGKDVISTQYDFVGNIRKTQTEHYDGTTTTTIKRRFTYDQMDRLLDTFHQINSLPEERIARNSYNELGQLESKDLHTGEQMVDYDYNIRGWLRKINNGTSLSGGDLFGLSLRYDEGGLYNGNISQMLWSKSNDNATFHGYVYTYDGLNRLLDADHTSDVHTDLYDVDGPSGFIEYDLNGNIRKLRREGESATGYLDNLSYSYQGNQLTQVDDTGDDTAGFTESGGGTDYAYDANGNMISDANKGITDIDYNHLNLPVKVTFDASNYLEYHYDAAGIKLQQKVYNADTLTKATDYVGEFIYEDGALELIQHDEGRIIPLESSHPEFISGSKEYDYQYHLKDHLGNVRVTFATTPEVFTMMETFESAQGNGFQNLNRELNTTMNKTPAGAFVSGVTSGQLGAMVFLSVNKGDQLSMNVAYDYDEVPSNNNHAGIAATDLFNAFDAAYGVGENAVTTSTSLFSSAIAGMLGSRDPGERMAFMNYIYFDKDMNVITSGFSQAQRLTETWDENAEDWIVSGAGSMTIPSFAINQQGYVLVYLSNESASSFKVYFDQFGITHNKTNIVSTQDYYPFGLTFNESVRTASVGQNFQFGGKEKDDITGWTDFGARMYMDDIGRWGVVDPLADVLSSFSPYNYALNNPIVYVDPDGQFPIKISVRSFAPFDGFGFGNWRGDGASRGYTTSSTATSRLSQTTNYETDDGSSNTTASGSFSSGNFCMCAGGGPVFARSEASLDDYSGSGRIITHLSGNDDAVTGLDGITGNDISPDIDVHTDLGVSLSDADDSGNQLLTIAGTISGDGFPASESFVTDSDGNSVFIGVSDADYGPNTGPFLMLFGDSERKVQNVGVSIQVNSEGIFQGVIGDDGKLTSIEEWNKQFTSSNPTN